MDFQQLTPQKSANLPAIILLITQKNINESISVSNFNHLEQIYINERSMYFCQETETEIAECIMPLNKEGDINDVSRKFLFMCKNYALYYSKE